MPSNLRAGIVALLVVIVVGSIGFMVIGDLSIGDAMYVTIITISTLGYNEIGGPFLGGTRIWVVVVLISGMGAALYIATAAVEYGFETAIGSDYRKRRKMQKDVSSMNDHIIVCGFGRVGASAWRALTRDGLDTVVHSSAVEFRIQRFVVPENSQVVGQTIADLDLRRDSGAMVIGVAAPDATIRVNPDPHLPFKSGDGVFGLGQNANSPTSARSSASQPDHDRSLTSRRSKRKFRAGNSTSGTTTV